MTDHPDHTECHFTGDFFTGLALVEMPIRDVENLHGYAHERQADAEDGTPRYVCVGLVEWRRERSYKSRGERRLGKMTFGDGD